MLIPEELQAGDVLLYSPTDWIGWLICIKTWTALSHAEVYCGNGRCVAARSHGVDVYQERIDDSLRYVRRPVMPVNTRFNIRKAMESVKPMLGRPYEVGGLFYFYLPWMRRHKATLICSSVVTVFVKAGGCDLFSPDIDPHDIAPAQLLQTNDLLTIYDRETTIY